MAPLHLSNSAKLHHSACDEHDAVEMDRKWHSPLSSKRRSSTHQSPAMRRRSDRSLPEEDTTAVCMSSIKTTSEKQTPKSLFPSSMLGKNMKKQQSNPLHDNISEKSSSALAESDIIPPTIPNRKISTCTEDESLPMEISEEFYMGLNDRQKSGERRNKMRRFRRNGGVQRAFSESELSEASTINSQGEVSKNPQIDQRKKSLLQRKRERLASKFLRRRNKNSNFEISSPIHDEDDDVEDTDKDLAGFTGIARPKSSHSKRTHTNENHFNSMVGNQNRNHHEAGTAVATKSKSEIELETRSRVSKSPVRFPSRSRSRGRARSSSRRGSLGSRRGSLRNRRSSLGAEASTPSDGKKKKKKKSTSLGTRTRSRSNQHVLSDGEDDSSLKDKLSDLKVRTDKYPRQRHKLSRNKRKGSSSKQKVGCKPTQASKDYDGSQQTFQEFVIDVLPTQDFVSPCTIGSGRRSVLDMLSLSQKDSTASQSCGSRVSALTMSTNFSPVSSTGFNDDFSWHSVNTKSSLRGPQHVPHLKEKSTDSESLLITGHLSTLLEASIEPSVRTTHGLQDGVDDLGGSSTPRSSLTMPVIPKRRLSSEFSASSSRHESIGGGLFDSENDDSDEEEAPLYERYATMIKQCSSSDLMRSKSPIRQRPAALLQRAVSERKLGNSGGPTERVWRRGKKKPQKSPKKSQNKSEG